MLVSYSDWQQRNVMQVRRREFLRQTLLAHPVAGRTRLRSSVSLSNNASFNVGTIPAASI